MFIIIKNKLMKIISNNKFVNIDLYKNSIS